MRGRCVHIVRVVKSAGITGITGYIVDVECDISNGMPSFDIVGLPDAAVKESRDRVRAAIKNCGYDFPLGRITVNLAPASTKKVGSLYDLPILLCILSITQQVSTIPNDSLFIGEISLEGKLSPIAGAISMSIAAGEHKIKHVFVPQENAKEASLASGTKIYPVKHINDILDHISNKKLIEPIDVQKPTYNPDSSLDFAHVLGQENVKRALEISASGGHNILLVGSPGSGKSMMAKRLISILPPLTTDEHLEVLKIYSAIGKSTDIINSICRPFRSPHHTTSAISITGGGQNVPRPGEVSLSHNGVLFLDELPEFSKNALESLRQPLEDKYINISRVNAQITYPCNFMMICTMNPCKCGFYGSDSRKCICSKEQVRRYNNRLSGPLLDRIDMRVFVQPVKYKDLRERRAAEDSYSIRERVLSAISIQKNRFKGTNVSFNSQIPPSMIAEFCRITEDAEEMLSSAFKVLNLTARSYDRILKVSRTIADLNNHDIIEATDIAETLQYRE